MATSCILICASTESSRTRSMPSTRPELNFMTGPPYTRLDVDADRRLQERGGRSGSCARHGAGFFSEFHRVRRVKRSLVCVCAGDHLDDIPDHPGENYHAPSREQQVIRDLVEAHSVNSIT